MARVRQEMVLCQVCKEQKKMSEVLTAELVRGPIVEKIMETHPDWSSQGFICIADLNRYRAEYVNPVVAYFCERDRPFMASTQAKNALQPA